MNQVSKFIALAMFWASVACGHARAAEIKCLFPLAFKSSLSELVPQFEKSTGNTGHNRLCDNRRSDGTPQEGRDR
jgi:hypothetical protein